MTVRHDRGLAASPRVWHKIEVERSSATGRRHGAQARPCRKLSANRVSMSAPLVISDN
jgi:hypothetical protein